ncbi:MAG: methyltransferase domain-containing protein [Rubellimicrobium sp.]|nr:methyltransferase domain-containing protein [Rubellimicrobium sp.]
MPRDAAESSMAPRRAALALLHGVLAERHALSDMGAITAPLAPDGRARAQRLAADVLRGLSRADRMLHPHLGRRPPMFVLNVLRLGVTELAQGAAAHGVVNDMVAITGAERRHASMRGLVNAVLRRVAPDAPAAWAAQPVPRLPAWLRRPLVRAWGEAATGLIESVQAVAPPLDLTARGDPAPLAQAVGGRVLPTGSVRLSGPVQVTALPGHEGGAFWVQDAAAALPARALGVRPGERVLDLCAAPGGKTLQLAAAGAAVTALDISAARLVRLHENLARTGLEARVVEADALEFHEDGWDAILLDAPCSATGTIRRHPDLPHVKDGAGIGDLAALQARMIDHAAGLLRPGGRLVFATCSLLPQEGEDQLAAALARNPGLGPDPAALALPGVAPGWHSPGGGLRLRPDHWAEAGGIDGFFIAALRKA